MPRRVWSLRPSDARAWRPDVTDGGRRPCARRAPVSRPTAVLRVSRAPYARVRRGDRRRSALGPQSRCARRRSAPRRAPLVSGVPHRVPTCSLTNGREIRGVHDDIARDRGDAAPVIERLETTGESGATSLAYRHRSMSDVCASGHTTYVLICNRAKRRRAFFRFHPAPEIAAGIGHRAAPRG